ncbi:MAG TPA: response regulator, partial [Ignavibacteriaceae bacterium]|nr:response regulator [Ignavibacteriaceae bacterium]
TKLSILIVEDSSDVRKYLSGLLSFEVNGAQTFEVSTSLSNKRPRRLLNILEAENGEEGLKLAVEKMPDLIISDIMMPYMDGIEFCQKIKSNWETSHIPLILLTAKASSESKIEGLETGADDYLTKPFDSKELFVRVKNLLEQRKLLKEKFSKEIRINAESLTTNTVDNEFLNKALAIAEKNISNIEFDSEFFAKEMFVSRSQLNRKLQALTGQGPGEFIRLIRLKRAAELILEKRLSITQIAYEIGFNSPSHFTKAFHNQFNCLPSDFTEICNKSAKV